MKLSYRNGGMSMNLRKARQRMKAYPYFFPPFTMQNKPAAITNTPAY
jgi:hypothetical protein